MTTTRGGRVRIAAVSAASALALAGVLGGCSSGSDADSGSAEIATGTAAATAGAAAQAGPEELRALLPEQAAFGAGFVAAPVTTAQLEATLNQVRDKAKTQVVDPADCKDTLDLTAGLDPAATAMVAAGNEDQGTKIGVIVSRDDTSLDAFRSSLDRCGTVTVQVDGTTTDVTTEGFAPAGATGEEPLGITRTQSVGDAGNVTTILTAEEVDGTAIRVMVHQPSTEALTPEVLDHFRQTAATLMNDTATRVAQK
ncbi:hypothetical protein [Tomitella fengzijianii]|uniref:DUF5642 domain-containing protein n=1 Tax=Tomitella fengzijianii TaxID=2597660 RepID=A0A516X718_9ACTN|nr:hypothetical protein [Tomitella fengzijianii]QDQ98867.1 hypothetical protein FO059_17835 [Tomitella fengzijianii]